MSLGQKFLGPDRIQSCIFAPDADNKFLNVWLPDGEQQPKFNAQIIRLEGYIYDLFSV